MKPSGGVEGSRNCAMAILGLQHRYHLYATDCGVDGGRDNGGVNGGEAETASEVVLIGVGACDGDGKGGGGKSDDVGKGFRR